MRRVVRILSILQSGTCMSVPSLQVEFGVSRRTIFRDLSLLRGSGIPIGADALDGQLSFDPAHRVLTKVLSPDEIRAIALAAKVSTLMGAPQLRSQVQAAIAKLLGTIRSGERRAIHRLLRHCTSELDRSIGFGAAGILETIVKSIGQQQCVRLHYRDPKTGQSTQTKFHPYSLSFLNSGAAVVGKSPRHVAIQRFSLSLIQAIEVLPDTFTIKKSFYMTKKLGAKDTSTHNALPKRKGKRNTSVQSTKQVNH